MPSKTRSARWWNIKASWRDTLLLLREFRRPLIVFSSSIVLGGALYQAISQRVGEPIDSLPAAFYLILSLSFLQANIDFPRSALLQAFFFIMPLIGVGTLALGLAEFGVMLFNRRTRSKEWEMAIASTYSNHKVLVGLGHLGFRVVRFLHEMDEQVVAIELNPSADLVNTVQKMHIPVLQDDASRETVLQDAGIARASAIVLCTQNDALNLQIALKARNINPKIQVIIRIFDDDFASALRKQFGFIALSATSMAAPAFAAAAAGADVTPPIQVENESFSLARIGLMPGSILAGKAVSEIEENYNLSVVLLRKDGETEYHPSGSRKLGHRDVIAVLGNPEKINRLVHDSQ